MTEKPKPRSIREAALDSIATMNFILGGLAYEMSRTLDDNEEESETRMCSETLHAVLSMQAEVTTRARIIMSLAYLNDMKASQDALKARLAHMRVGMPEYTEDVHDAG